MSLVERWFYHLPIFVLDEIYLLIYSIFYPIDSLINVIMIIIYLLKAKYTVAHKCHGKTYFLAAKLSFSRLNLLSRGKTFFLTAKYFYNHIWRMWQSTMEGWCIWVLMKIRWMIWLENTFSRDRNTEKYAYFLKEITNAPLVLPLLREKSSKLVCVGECHAMTSVLQEEQQHKCRMAQIAISGAALYGFIFKWRAQELPVKLWQLHLKS